MHTLNWPSLVRFSRPSHVGMFAHSSAILIHTYTQLAKTGDNRQRIVDNGGCAPMLEGLKHKKYSMREVPYFACKRACVRACVIACVVACVCACVLVYLTCVGACVSTQASRMRASYVCMYVCMYVYIHTCIYMYIHIYWCMLTCLFPCVHSMFLCVPGMLMCHWVYACSCCEALWTIWNTYACMCVHMYVCMYVWYVCMISM